MKEEFSLKRKYLIGVFLMAFCVLAALFTPSAYAIDEAKDDFEIIIERRRNALVGGDYDENDESVQAIIKSRDNQGTNAWKTMIKKPDRTLLWEGQLLDKYTTGAGINQSFVNLRAMAVAYGMKGTSVYHNEELKKDIIDGLDFLNRKIYYKGDRYTRTGQLNWFFWEISIQQHITNTLCIMYDEVDEDLRMRLVEACLNYLPDPARGGLDPTSSPEGSNRIWICCNHILLGALSKNVKLIDRAKETMEVSFAYADEIEIVEGFKTDGSCAMHPTLPYTGGYGKDGFSEVVDVFSIIDGTEFAYDEEKRQVVYDIAFNTFVPVIYKCLIFDSTRGRYTCRESTTAYTGGLDVLKALFKLSVNAPSDIKMRLQRIVKQHLLTSEECMNSFFKSLSIELSKDAWDMLHDDTIPPMPYENEGKFFAGMEMGYYKNEDFAFVVNLFSKRYMTYESINDEDLKGWYKSHGATYIYNDDLKHYTDNYWSTVDYYKLAGTTVTDAPRSNGYMQAYVNTKEWVGGATLDKEFVAIGMDFEDYRTPIDTEYLTAKKSWFMIDGQVIALGSGIKNPQKEVDNNTFVENRVVSKDDKFYVDGKEFLYGDTVAGSPSYIFYDGAKADIGYCFLQKSDVELKTLENSGRWKDVRSSDGSEVLHTKPYMQIKIGHGVQPVNDSYAYVLLPGTTLEEVSQYSKNPSTVILENTPRAAAVKNDENGVTAVNFWQNESYSIDGITVDKASCVVKREKGDELSFAISEPTQIHKELIVEFDKEAVEIVYLDEDIEVLQMSPTLKLKLNVFESLGYTFSGIVKIKNTDVPSVMPPYTMGNKKITAVRECRGKVYKNNVISQCDVPVYDKGRLMVSVNFVSEILGAQVSFDEAKNTVCAENGTFKGTFVVDGSDTSTQAKIIDGHYYLPLRITAEQICGKKVLYDNGTVIIYDKNDEIDEAICEYFKLILE